jgi:hypothetical protein
VTPPEPLVVDGELVAPTTKGEPPRRVLRIVTDDDLAPVVPATAERRAAGGRASVPAWADVLLGVTPAPARTDRDED